MDERNINIIGGYNRPFWFPFASVYTPVTPCVLDGSLSFLEMVWKLLKDLNKVVEASNANHTDILTIVSEIEKIYGIMDGKLDYLEVNFTDDHETIIADQTYSDIIKGYRNGLVIGRMTRSNVERFYIALDYDDGLIQQCVKFYSVNDLMLDVIKVGENTISRDSYALITDIGGTITGILNVPDPTQNAHAANKKYVDERANEQKVYTDNEIVAVKLYIDEKDGTTLQAAKDYADGKDATTLQSAKDYADGKFIPFTGNAGSAYGTHTMTDRTFTDIPLSPDTITIDALLNKLSRWYQEIKNKVTTGTVTVENSTPKCDLTFDVMKNLIDEGQLVILHYMDPLMQMQTNVLMPETFTATTITWKNATYTIKINSSDVVTVS